MNVKDKAIWHETAPQKRLKLMVQRQKKKNKKLSKSSLPGQ